MLCSAPPCSPLSALRPGGSESGRSTPSLSVLSDSRPPATYQQAPRHFHVPGRHRGPSRPAGVGGGSSWFPTIPPLAPPVLRCLKNQQMGLHIPPLPVSKGPQAPGRHCAPGSGLERRAVWAGGAPLPSPTTPPGLAEAWSEVVGPGVCRGRVPDLSGDPGSGCLGSADRPSARLLTCSLSFLSVFFPDTGVKDNIYRKPPIYKQHGTVPLTARPRMPAPCSEPRSGCVDA